MNSRITRGGSDTIGLFPFLAVLLSTMGALLVLLVVLAQKAKQQAIERVVSQAHASIQDLPSVDRVAANEVRQLQLRLEQLHHDQQQLAKLQEQAEASQRDEQLRLSHLEEHTRRLEHELAKLQLASQQLQATENKQLVDQEQAKHELTRLKKLIEDSRLQVDSLRKQAVGKRSYAIIPYKGPQGTVRRPIYLECDKDGVVIQPEGIRLTSRDFLTRFDSGNPLAKALRAARDLLNTRAAKAGDTEPPDPYPLLVVRPDGIQQYLAARTAIKSWDADFGYEFIDQQWTLQYPESDPEMAQVMQHAVLQGRERTAMLIQNAPRRYGRLGLSASLNHRRSGSGDSAGKFSGGSSQDNGWNTNTGRAGPSSTGTQQGFGIGNQANGFTESSAPTGERTNHDTVTDRIGSTLPNGNSSNGQSPDGAAGNNTYSATTANRSTDDLAHGSAESLEGSGEPVHFSSGAGTQSSNSQFASADNVEQYGTEQFSANRAGGGAPGPEGKPSSGSGGSASGTASSGGSKGSGNSASTAQTSNAVQFSSGSADTMASTRGSNWAMQGQPRGSVPIRRPIQVVIRKDRIAILRSRHTDINSALSGAVIGLNQPTAKVMDEFASALREHMKDWGLAGNGLYWRPVLQLNIGPQGQQQAARFTRLLKDSGVEIGAPRTSRHNQEVPADATR
ncbi:MAG: hypothetical protein ABGX16_23470 [Pirellulales bacterium]